MADSPSAELKFHDDSEDVGCFSCAERIYAKLMPLPNVGDDFDWQVRDYDGFRRFMIEELAARFPERQLFSPADIEVLLTEVLAASLDHLSDMADRVFAEGYLKTARQPASVRRHLALIGYDSVAEADAEGQIDIDISSNAQDANARLETFWAANPHAMEIARSIGPKTIHTQHRMVNIQDYAERIEDHPLVARTIARADWTGAKTTVFTGVISVDSGAYLDDAIERPSGAPNSAAFKRRDKLLNEVKAFNERHRLPVPIWTNNPTLRTLLRPYVDLYRMAGQEVILENAVRVGITLVISIIVNRSYFTSEIDRAAHLTLGSSLEGFFRPGRLRFGEDLYASDIIAALMQIDGVENVCVVRFKRTGDKYPDQSASGRIRLTGLEVAVCDNNRSNMSMGYISLTTQGGLSG